MWEIELGTTPVDLGAMIGVSATGNTVSTFRVQNRGPSTVYRAQSLAVPNPAGVRGFRHTSGSTALVRVPSVATSGATWLWTASGNATVVVEESGWVGEYPVFDGKLEVRQRSGGGRMIQGVFPYGKTATIRSAGRLRKERFAGGSLSWQTRKFAELNAELQEVIDSAMDELAKAKALERLEDALERRNTFLLSGHDYNRSIADMRSGTLAVEHKADGVHLRASIPPEGEAPSWVEDTIRGIKGGQVRGISPGFQVPGGRGAERADTRRKRTLDGS